MDGWSEMDWNGYMTDGDGVGVFLEYSVGVCNILPKTLSLFQTN